MRPTAKAFTYYMHVVTLLGLFLFFGAALIGFPHLKHPAELVIFFLIILLGELMPIKSPGTNVDVTMTVPATLSLLLSNGPYAALLVCTTAIFVGGIIAHSGRNVRWLISTSAFNAAACVLTIVAACLVYQVSGGTVVGTHGAALSSIALPLILYVTASTSSNILVFTTGVALYNREPWRLLLAQNIRWFLPNYLITAPSGILFAYLYQQYAIYGILLIIVPFIIGRQALNLYSRQMESYRDTITTLGTYMQQYHPYTKGHLERVADLSDKMARHMSLPIQSLMFIRDAGLLHDIGKVGVNEAILDKIGQLTDDEWATIRQHPARGAEILAQMKHLERIVPWVRGHHERPDGRGYPDGLKSSEIPLEAAVIAVADAFDAMAGRIYEGGKTMDQAMNEVRYGAGTQFDPRVVKAFVQVMAREESGND